MNDGNQGRGAVRFEYLKGALVLAGIALLPEAAMAAPGGGGDGIRQPQGRKLQGGVETPSYATPASVRLSASTALPIDFDGRNDVTNKTLKFRILSKTFPHLFDGKPTVDTEYEVQVAEVGAPGGLVFRNLCSASAAENRAIAVEGSWDAKGNYTRDPRRITFSCTDGLIAKCIDWTYRAEPPDSTSTVVVPLPLYHQACTRMGRADYCGTSQPNTVEGTYVFFYDDINHVPYPTNHEPPGFFQEGGWAPGGACCLGKKRWATLPLNGPCPNVLPDPRAQPVAGGRAKFCEELPRAASPVAPGPNGCPPGTTKAGGLCVRPIVGGTCSPILFNHSEMLDAGLYRWQNATGESLTTTAGFWGGAYVEATEPPMRGFDKAEYEGTVYRSERAGPNLVGIEHAEVARIPLYVYEGKTASGARDLMTVSPQKTLTRNTVPAGYKEIGLIGWIFPPVSQPAIYESKVWRRNARLYLHIDAQGRHLTTTRASVPGYTMQSVIGLLPALPTP